MSFINKSIKKEDDITSIRQARSARIKSRKISRENLKNIDWANSDIYAQVVQKRNRAQTAHTKQSEMSYNEINHYYKMVKNPVLKESLTPKGRQRLIDHGWKTLEHLMRDLLLVNEYKLLHLCYQRKMK